MKTKGLLITAWMLSFLAAPIQAATTSYLDFNCDAIHPQGASIFYNVGGALQGSNISVDVVTGYDAFGISTGTYDSFNNSNALLDFTTGGLVAAMPNIWFFGSGGSISITAADGSRLWLQGNFQSALVVGSGDTFKVTIASFLDTKDARLLEYFGFPANISGQGNLNLSFFAQTNYDGSFESTSVLSGNIVNTPVPVPTSIWFLGSGLIGVIGLKKKKI